MSKFASFSLDDHFSAFIEELVSRGRYRNASEVVQAGLRLLEIREVGIQALREALIEGENSGPSTSFDFETFFVRRRGAETPA